MPGDGPLIDPQAKARAESLLLRLQNKTLFDPPDVGRSQIAHHGSDWCHICGRRRDHLADIWYPNNAEHAEKMNLPNDKYIRICTDCGNAIARVAPPPAGG